MNKNEIKHPDLPDTSTSPYSMGVTCDDWLYISGQGPLDLKTKQIVGDSIEDQTRLTLRHIENILHAAGCTFDDVVKCTCYLSDINDFDAFSEIYREFFAGVRPARTTVEAKLWHGIKVEVDAIARIPDVKNTA